MVTPRDTWPRLEKLGIYNYVMVYNYVTQKFHVHFVKKFLSDVKSASFALAELKILILNKK